VDESASAMLAARLIRQSKPNPMPRAVSATVVSTTCKPPRPRMDFLRRHSIAGSSSSPMTNNIMITPNSANCMTASASVMNPRANGPIRIPASKYPSTEPSLKRLASGTTAQAAARKTKTSKSNPCIYVTLPISLPRRH
jgi:hypothetical protein